MKQIDEVRKWLKNHALRFNSAQELGEAAGEHFLLVSGDESETHPWVIREAEKIYSKYFSDDEFDSDDHIIQDTLPDLDEVEDYLEYDYEIAS